MSLSAAGSVIDLSDYVISPDPIDTDPPYDIFSAWHRCTNVLVTVRKDTFLFDWSSFQRIDFSDSLGQNFQDVANLLHTVHPVFSSFIGWNVKSDRSHRESYIVTKYMSLRPMEI
jgi:hypothetical protein